MFTCFIFARVIGDDETQGKSTYFPHLSLKFSSTKCTKESEEDRRIHFVTSEEGTLFDIDRRSLFLLPLNDDFFSSGMADHALRLGPYMRRSC